MAKQSKGGHQSPKGKGSRPADLKPVSKGTENMSEHKDKSHA